MAEEHEPEIEIDEELLLELVEDPEVSDYTIQTNINDGAFRLTFKNEGGELLGCFTTDSAGAYDLAQRILKAYDKLEGL